MSFEFLSDEQVACYGCFPEEPSAAELEQFFRLDRSALDALASKRRPATKLGWAVQWGFNEKSARSFQREGTCRVERPHGGGAPIRCRLQPR
ncbi:DUF4158 domain-containing protein [Streptosporangium sp. NPDC003464]